MSWVYSKDWYKAEAESMTPPWEKHGELCGCGVCRDDYEDDE